jgi:DMSO/TMAO reductase YedYZ molybdopterin-dependent catalytic subunit
VTDARAADGCAADARLADGRPRVPPGQFETEKFPVLTYGTTPDVAREDWSLEIAGLVEAPVTIPWGEFARLPRTTLRADFHCVTTWSRLDLIWEGVAVTEAMKQARPRAGARAVLAHCHGGYTTNLALDDFLREGNLFAFRVDGADLPREHGGPVRLLVPHLYGWKSAKWVKAIEFLAEERLGFWEKYGYHPRGDPWKEERFG